MREECHICWRNLQLQPGCDVLLESFLGSELIGDYYNRPIGEATAQQRRQKGLGCLADAGAGQYASVLHAGNQGLRGGSVQDLREQIACRSVYQVWRQAGPRSLWAGLESSWGKR